MGFAYVLMVFAGELLMTREELHKRISIDPNVCFGKACIRGTRLWVSLILDNFAEGISEKELLDNYPRLTHEDVLAAIAYGAEMARERFVPLPMEKSA
jgi:uncharacterized protein (DUF433 family)